MQIHWLQIHCQQLSKGIFKKINILQLTKRNECPYSKIEKYKQRRQNLPGLLEKKNKDGVRH